MMRDDFPARLRYAMQRRNMTPAKLAQAVGVSRRHVEKWLSGDRPTTRPRIAIDIARALKIKRSFFIEEPPPEDIPGRIRLLCAMRGLTLKDASRKARIPEQTIFSWLWQRNNPTQEPISSVDACHALGTGSKGGCASAAVAHRAIVRRLTPRECEILMGLPPDWTLIPWRGKPPEQCPDGPRYRACGNSMAANCMAWIGRRLDAVDKGTPLPC